MQFIFGIQRQWNNLEFVWWGKSQWYKFRWHGDHIDLGVFSIYNLPESGAGKVFWRIVSMLIKPLRVLYHKRYVYSVRGQVKNILTLAKLKKVFSNDNF